MVWKLLKRSPLSANAAMCGASNRTAVARQLPEAEIIEHDHDDVRGVGRRTGRRRPVLGRFGVSVGYDGR